ncbi:MULTISPECIES: AzlD domain-containing protein [Alcaligenaceae]|jgi:branched-subunit amino acid transport protein|uniref:Branched-chain amino acid transporter n=1 Tax=Neopusillimonas maritima TaxID=2026239 RepID=A0ABX9MZ58_9BURK|nr:MULTISPECIES: AzlD domain-containing protein [Alcaligenaceae]MAL01501.1 hypothetical protein [Alcaligenaceae bacterium]MBF23480.1 hypothetical protein [Pusillimonas sp.]QIM48941.1 AzlD domain-containing protein [Pusillimonas sp. DMV24BSW_D]RII84269.1 hypothetical protein CJO09_03375 [Neopusillimonas maritima]|tara:strand:+ start:388 stop:723 length:336 start_codon:yes stop_codon:yes gene_type:complete
MFEPGTDAYILAVIVFLTLCSLITRAGYFLFGDYLPLTDGIRRALRYAPPAALIAIVVPEVLPWGEGAAAFVDLKMLAVLVAVLVYLRTRSAVLVMVSGMVAYWVIRALLG